MPKKQGKAKDEVRRRLNGDAHPQFNPMPQQRGWAELQASSDGSDGLKSTISEFTGLAWLVLYRMAFVCGYPGQSNSGHEV